MKILIKLIFTSLLVGFITCERCRTNFGLNGDCVGISDCTGGTFPSTKCARSNQICCVDDPYYDRQLENYIGKSPYDLSKFLRLTGDTPRNRALFGLFNKAMDDANINDKDGNECHKAATFFAQLFDETDEFTRTESTEETKDYDNEIGNDSNGDGAKYRGRGAILLRGKTNYRKANSEILGFKMIDFIRIITY
jgi:hypothetical protein